MAIIHMISLLGAIYNFFHSSGAIYVGPFDHIEGCTMPRYVDTIDVHTQYVVINKFNGYIRSLTPNSDRINWTNSFGSHKTHVLIDHAVSVRTNNLSTKHWYLPTWNPSYNYYVYAVLSAECPTVFILGVSMAGNMSAPIEWVRQTP